MKKLAEKRARLPRVKEPGFSVGALCGFGMLILGKGSFIGGAACFGKLVSAGGSSAIAGYAADFLFHLGYGEPLY